MASLFHRPCSFNFLFLFLVCWVKIYKIKFFKKTDANISKETALLRSSFLIEKKNTSSIVRELFRINVIKILFTCF